MIIGVGIDVAEIDRFAAALERTPQLADRLFIGPECPARADRRGIASLAARFAAKEALAKALGAPGGLSWTDAEVCVEESGQAAAAGHAARSRPGRPSWACAAGTSRSATTRASPRPW